MTLLLGTLNPFNKSLTRLKVTFHETAQEYFWARNLTTCKYFFVDHQYSILSQLQNLLGLWHSYLDPQSIWTSPWLDWKSLFMKLHKSIFELEIWQRAKYFFVDHLYSILSLLQNLLGLWHSYLDPQSIWTSPWLDWKSLLMKLHRVFWARNWQRAKYFFRRSPIFDIISASNLRGLWHSYLDPKSIWTSPWLDWRHFSWNCTRLFLSSKFDNVSSTFFVDHLYPILSLHQNLLGLWDSYLDPQSIWTSPWLDWKSLFMKLHKCVWARNLTTC